MDAEFAAALPHLHHRARNQVRKGGVEVGSADNSAGSVSRSRSARRTAIALAVLSAIFYVGIILIMAWR